MDHDTGDPEPVTFAFRSRHARWRIPFLLVAVAAIVSSVLDLRRGLILHGSLGALLSSPDANRILLDCAFPLIVALFTGVFWFVLARRQILSIDRDSFRWTGPAAFAVPVSEIRRLSVFGDDIGLAAYTVETRTGETQRFAIYAPGLRREIWAFLDEVERRTGLRWIGVSEANRAGDQRGFLEVLRASARIGSRRELVRWFLTRSMGVSIGDLGLNDKLVRTGYNILEGPRVLWSLVLFVAASDLAVLWPLGRPTQLGLVAVVLVSMVAIGIHTSLGVNVILTLAQGEIRRRERLEQELDTARSVQERLNPQKDPQVPGFEIAGVCVPAREVGGDYYDYIPSGDGGTVVAVADVSGKGLGPGLLMTLTKGALVSSLRGAPSLEAALGQVNGTLRGAVQKHMFVSMALAKLSSRDGNVVIARAGHNPPLVVRGDGRAEWVRPSGVALGLASNRVFEKACGVQQVPVATGDTLVLYTDGLTEAMNPDSEQYGDERLAAAVSGARHLDAPAMRDFILRDVAGFRGSAQVADDLTLVVVKVTA